MPNLSRSPSTRPNLSRSPSRLAASGPNQGPRRFQAPFELCGHPVTDLIRGSQTASHCCEVIDIAVSKMLSVFKTHHLL